MSSSKMKHAWRTMVTKYESHNAELKKKETELRHRLHVIECCLPVLLVGQSRNKDVRYFLNHISELKGVGVGHKNASTTTKTKESMMEGSRLKFFISKECVSESFHSLAASLNNSNCSLDTNDKVCFDKLKKLVKRERALLTEIEKMKQCEEDYKRRLSEFNDNTREPENNSIPIENMNEYLGKENARLAAELRDLKVDLRNSIQKAQDPLAFQLDKEEKRTEVIGEQIIDKAKAMGDPEPVFDSEVVSLQTTLMSTCQSMSTLKEDNESLKQEIKVMKSKINKLQKDFLEHSASKDFTYKMCREVKLLGAIEGVTAAESVISLEKRKKKKRERNSFQYAPAKRLRSKRRKSLIINESKEKFVLELVKSCLGQVLGASSQRVPEDAAIKSYKSPLEADKGALQSVKSKRRPQVHNQWSNMSSSLTDSGTMQVVSRGRGGNIKTVVTCSISGMIEIQTEMEQDNMESFRSSSSVTAANRPAGIKGSRSDGCVCSLASATSTLGNTKISMSSQTERLDICEGSTSVEDLASQHTNVDSFHSVIGPDKDIMLKISVGDTVVGGRHVHSKYTLGIPLKKTSNDTRIGGYGGSSDTALTAPGSELKFQTSQHPTWPKVSDARHYATNQHHGIRCVKSEHKSLLSGQRISITAPGDNQINCKGKLPTEFVNPKRIKQEFVCARCMVTDGAYGHLPNCDCVDCLCDPCANPPPQHPPDCDCADCICDPCEAPKKHPSDCDCADCTNKPATLEGDNQQSLEQPQKRDIKQPPRFPRSTGTEPPPRSPRSTVNDIEVPTCKCFSCECKVCQDPRKRPPVNACECGTGTVSQFCSCGPRPRYPGDCGCTFCPLGGPLGRDLCDCPSDACVCNPCGDPRRNRDIKLAEFKCDGCGKTCDCATCRCENCPDPSVVVHGPDCDCIDCLCDNCPDTRIHPANCDCPKCACDECPDESYLNIITEILKQIQCSCQNVEDCFNKAKPDKCGVKDMLILALSKEVKLKVGGTALNNLLRRLFDDPRVLDMLTEAEEAKAQDLVQVEGGDRLAQANDRVAELLSCPATYDQLVKDWDAMRKKDVTTSALEISTKTAAIGVDADIKLDGPTPGKPTVHESILDAPTPDEPISAPIKEVPVRDSQMKASDNFCRCFDSDSTQRHISRISDLLANSLRKRVTSPAKQANAPCTCPCDSNREKATKSRHAKRSYVRKPSLPCGCNSIPPCIDTKTNKTPCITCDRSSRQAVIDTIMNKAPCITCSRPPCIDTKTNKTPCITCDRSSRQAVIDTITNKASCITCSRPPCIDTKTNKTPCITCDRSSRPPSIDSKLSKAPCITCDRSSRPPSADSKLNKAPCITCDRSSTPPSINIKMSKAPCITCDRSSRSSLIGTPCTTSDRSSRPSSANTNIKRVGCITCDRSRIQYPSGPTLDVTPMEFETMRRLDDNAILIKWQRPANPVVVGYELFVNDRVMYKVRNAARTTAILYGLSMDDCIEFTLFALNNEGRCNPPVAAVFQP